MSKLILSASADFANLALDELRQIDAGMRPTAQFEDGVYLVSLTTTFWHIAQAWQEQPPTFVRHICPVFETVPLERNSDDLIAIDSAVATQISALVEPELTFSVQTRIFGDLPYKRFDINQTISASVAAQSGAKIDVRAPQQILSIVCAAAANLTNGDETATAYIGLSLAAQNISDWAGGMRRFAREPDRISRAEFKLLEALEFFAIRLPERGVALDLGAAPGGWTRVLRQREQYVTAVDPGRLDRRLVSDKGIRHLRKTAEAYLADGPDRFDLIVNDMRIDARDSARIMVSYAPHLYRHGLAIMTLKLPERGRRNIIDHACKILGRAYTVCGIRHLFHNRSEVTVYLRPPKWY